MGRCVGQPGGFRFWSLSGLILILAGRFLILRIRSRAFFTPPVRVDVDDHLIQILDLSLRQDSTCLAIPCPSITVSESSTTMWASILVVLNGLRLAGTLNRRWPNTPSTPEMQQLILSSTSGWGAVSVSSCVDRHRIPTPTLKMRRETSRAA